MNVIKKIFELLETDVKYLAEQYGTPLMVMSEKQIEYNYKLLTENIPNLKVFYAVKSNPQEELIKTLLRNGSSFDVASAGEIEQLIALGVPPGRIIYANPIKTIHGLKTAQKHNVNFFTFDSAGEILKMSQFVPGGKVLLRMKVENSQALIDLNTKFGVSSSEIMPLLRMARDKGLDVQGLCFHVGSQVLDAKPYVKAIKICAEFYDRARKEGFAMNILDIGGGFPIPMAGKSVDLLKLFQPINEALNKYFPTTEIWSEPGRYICGTSCHLITSVIGCKEREGRVIYFLDEGMYGTFSANLFDHWEFEFETYTKRKKVMATFAGPSCDSYDIVFTDKLVPQLEEGDLLLVKNCGAYTSASASTFNGFAIAPLMIWERMNNYGK